MITCYKFNDSHLVPCQADENPGWINMENPDPEEIRVTAERLKLPPLFLSDPLDPKERPRLDLEDDSTLIIIRIPHLSRKGEKVIFSTTPLGLIVTKGVLITVCREAGMVTDLLNRGTRKPRSISVLRLTFKIFSECSSDFINHLGHMEELTDKAELSLSRAQQNEEIMTLLTVDKALINYTVALKSNRALMDKLMDGSIFHLSPEDRDLLEHALTENQQAIFMADIFGQVLGSMCDAFGTIISNNLNKVMKLLTGVTIILMLPTLIVGAYGMNVELPMSNQPMAFWILAFICLLSAALIWVFFFLKKWI